jgi:hypothetical protein
MTKKKVKLVAKSFFFIYLRKSLLQIAMNTIRISTFLIFLSVLFLTQSCVVDANYDLSKTIDMTVTAGKKIEFPVGSLEEIYLSDILDVDDNDYFKLDDKGDFYLYFEGKGTTYRYTSDSLRLSPYHSEEGDSYLNLTIPSDGAWTRTPESPFSYVNYLDIENKDFPEEVTALQSAEFTALASLKIKVAETSPFSQFYFTEGTTVTLPPWLIAGESETPGISLKDIHTLVVDKDFPVSGTTLVVCTLIGIDFTQLPANQGITGKGVLKMMGEINVKGKAYASSATIRGTHSGKVLETMTNSVDISEINFKKVICRIDHTLTFDDNTYMVGSLPEFISDAGAAADFTDVELNLELTNNFPAGFTFNTDLITKVDGSTVHKYHFGDANGGQSLVFPQGATTRYCFSESGQHASAGATDYKVGGLSDILSPVPDMIRLEGTIGHTTDGWTTLKSNTTYSVSMDYNIHVPISFGEDTKVTFTQDITGMDIHTEGDFYFKVGEILLTAVNTIPLGFTINPILIDKEGVLVPDLQIAVDNSIASGSLDSPSSTDIVLTITSQTKDITFDGIRLGLVARSDVQHKDEPLNSKQGIKFENIRVKLDSGITVDLGK